VYAQYKQQNGIDCGIFVVEYFKRTLDLFSSNTSLENLNSTQSSKNPMMKEIKSSEIRKEIMKKYMKYVVISLKEYVYKHFFREYRLDQSFGMVKGFYNIGNKCYLNAILQCLLSIDVSINFCIFSVHALCLIFFKNNFVTEIQCLLS
jgi:hypothetical protein